MAGRLLNTRDPLLAAARSNPLVKTLLKTAGLVIPELNRGPADSFYSKSRLNVPVRYSGVSIVGSASPTSHVISELIRDNGSTIAIEGASTGAGSSASKQPPKYLVVCEDWHNPEKLRTTVLSHLRQVAASARNARVLLLAVNSSAKAKDESEEIRRRSSVPAFEGFVRSLAKELGGNGTTVNGLVVSSSAEAAVIAKEQLLHPISFFLSGDSAFVSAQTLHLSPTATTAHGKAGGVASSARAGAGAGGTGAESERFLGGRVAVVTGAARGIGASIAARLHREGCRVVAVDVPQAQEQLEKTCKGIMTAAASGNATSSTAGSSGSGVVPLPLDITASDAPSRLEEFLLQQHQKDQQGQQRYRYPLSILVHNAGITRDKLLRNLRDEKGYWDDIMRVNYEAVLAINERLLSSSSPPSTGGAGTGMLDPTHGRVILLSSINGLAGARGQTNYSWTKGALSGYAGELSKLLRKRSSSASPSTTGGEDSSDAPSAFAVAPGFIETDMTGKIPFVMRHLGRRSNALLQGGLPEDVAATVAALCLPGFASASGQTLRVCGGNMVGR